MKIARYIGDLLYEYECVVIPGLGGFLSRDFPASIHPVKHYFSPPHREIVFNPYLRANDGLLLNHIALNEKLPYHEAKSKLDRFVLKCHRALSEGKRINFRDVGTLYYDKEGQIVFEPDTHTNYLPDAFGLSGFVSPPIRREEGAVPREPVFARPARKPAETPTPPPPPPKSVPRQPMVASRRPSGLRRQLVILGSAAAALLAGAAYMNKGVVSAYYQQYVGQASVLPVFYASPGEYLLMHLDKLPKDMVLIGNDLQPGNRESGKLKPATDDLRPAEPYKPKPEMLQQENVDTVEAVSDKEANTVEMGYMADLPKMDLSAPARPQNTVAEVKPSSMEEKSITPAAPAISKVETGNDLNPARGYYIVAGAFREKANAEKLVGELRSHSFDAAITGRTSGGLWRVTYERLESKEAALSRLNQIKQTFDKQAWLLVI